MSKILVREGLDDLCPCLQDTVFISEAGIKLKLKEVAIATAMKMYHLFREKTEAGQHNYQLVAMACMNLACKAHEVPCKMSDLVNTCYRCLHPDKKPLDMCELFWRLKESVAKYELIVLRIMNFNLHYQLPHPYLLHFLLSLSLWVDAFHVSSTQVVPASWTFLQDSFHTNLNLLHEPVVMATAVLYLAVKCRKVRIPSDGAKRQWWEVFCPTTTEKQLMEISEKIMTLYDKYNRMKLNEEYDFVFEDEDNEDKDSNGEQKKESNDDDTQ